MASGGKRAGAGRKAVAPGERRVQMIITIDPETKERLKAMAKANGVSVGRFIDNIISHEEK